MQAAWPSRAPTRGGVGNQDRCSPATHARARAAGSETTMQSARPTRARGGVATGGLLDGDGLGEVARLVDVEAAAAGDLVGEHLQRDDGEDGLEHPVDRGNLDG